MIPTRSIASSAALAVAAILAGCAQPAKSLYLWENFPRQQYDVLVSSGTSPDGQIQAMEAHAAKARGAAAALPPGFRAHLGMLYLGNGNAEQARQLWLAEKEAFPESSSYLDQLLKRLEGPGKDKSTAATKENPA